MDLVSIILFREGREEIEFRLLDFYYSIFCLKIIII